MVISGGQIPLLLQIMDGDGSSNEQCDRMARSLSRELEEFGVDPEVPQDASPRGVKGDAVTAGAIALAVLPTLVPKVIDFLSNWVHRSTGPTVKIKFEREGKSVEFSLSGGASLDADSRRALLEALGLPPTS